MESGKRYGPGHMNGRTPMAGHRKIVWQRHNRKVSESPVAVVRRIAGLWPVLHVVGLVHPR